MLEDGYVFHQIIVLFGKTCKVKIIVARISAYEDRTSTLGGWVFVWRVVQDCVNDKNPKCYIYIYKAQ